MPNQNNPISIRLDAATRAALEALRAHERDAVERGLTARVASRNAIICSAICEKTERLAAEQKAKARCKPRGKEQE